MSAAPLCQTAERRASPVLRPKDRWFELAAALCSVAALIAYLALGNEVVAIGALVIGALILAWSYLDVTGGPR